MFLDFYGNRFDARCEAVDYSRGIFRSKIKPKGLFVADLVEQRHNIASGCLAFTEIQHLFKQSCALIRAHKLKNEGELIKELLF